MRLPAGVLLGASLGLAGCLIGQNPQPSSEVLSREGPGLGVPVDVSHLSAIDVGVDPAGVGLPPGGGSAADGAVLYAQRCAACHGLDGRGGPADALASKAEDSRVLTVGSYWPYATTLFDYLRRAMPYDAPGTLSNDELYALTAHVLYLNDIVARDERLDRQRLPAISMPNRNAFPTATPLH